MFVLKVLAKASARFGASLLYLLGIGCFVGLGKFLRFLYKPLPKSAVHAAWLSMNSIKV